MGRKNILQYEQKRLLLLGAAKRGLNVSQAAALAGVHRSTLSDALKKGEQATSGRYHQFFMDWEQSIAQGVVDLLEKIDKAGDKNWQAAAWLLERIHPDRFARPEARIAINEKKDSENAETAQAQVVLYLPDNGRD